MGMIKRAGVHLLQQVGSPISWENHAMGTVSESLSVIAQHGSSHLWCQQWWHPARAA